jgi:hypothetical protein
VRKVKVTKAGAAPTALEGNSLAARVVLVGSPVLASTVLSCKW